MRWVGNVASVGCREMHTGFLWESQKERDHYEEVENSIQMDLREIGWRV
jgi:hypothetical protein